MANDQRSNRVVTMIDCRYDLGAPMDSVVATAMRSKPSAYRSVAVAFGDAVDAW